MPSTGKRHGEKARFRARMEELGEQQVRLLMSTGGLPMQLQPQILNCLPSPSGHRWQSKLFRYLILRNRVWISLSWGYTPLLHPRG